MGFGQRKDLKLYDNTKKKGRKIMGFTLSKDLDFYEKRWGLDEVKI